MELQCLRRMKDANVRITWWHLALHQVVHRPGMEMVVTDFLSCSARPRWLSIDGGMGGLWLSCRGVGGDEWLQGVVFGEGSHTHNLHHLIMSPHCVWRKAGGSLFSSKVSSLAVNSFCLHLTFPLKKSVAGKDLERIQIKESYISAQQYGSNSLKPRSFL